MIKKNYKDVHFINKGTQVIDKVYKGTDLVFEQGYTREQTGVPPITTTYQAIGKNLKDYKIYGNSIQGKLPDTYQEVEYIENTGTQYIDTEFTPDYTKNIEIKIVFEPTVSDSRYCLLSNFAVTDNLSLEVKENKGRIYSSIGNADSTIGTVSTSTKNTYLFNYDVINKKYTLTVNNQSVNGNMNATGISGGSMLVLVDQSKRFYLFRNPIKIYNLKISENGILIRNFIPCYRKSDNEIGLYDIVNNVFYTNQGTGEFLKGNSVQEKLPNIYQQVEYIESTGTQYIDTGININTTTSRYETKINPSLVSGTMGIFGTRNYTSSNLSSMNVFIINGAFRLDWLTGAGSYNVGNISSNTEYTISITRGLATINDVDYASGETTSIDGLYTFYIGNFNNAGSAYSTGFSGKIYYSKLYNNNILVFDGVPCYRKSDNVAGMYDLVTNTFFTNAGTGEFTVEANLPTPSTPIEIESVGDKTKNLFNYKTAITYKGSFDNNGVFHATDNDNRDNLVYKIQLYNGNTMVTNSSRNISITGTGTYRVTSPVLIQSGTTRIRFANNGTSIEFSINCDIDGSQFVGQYASIVFTVDDATVGASVISDIMFYVGNEPFDYEPYGYKIPVIVGNTTTNIYLDEPLRKIGDYADYVDFKNSKVVRNIAKKVLNGTEDWTMPGTIISGYSSYRIINFIPNRPLQTPIEELLCTHFEAFPKSQYQQEPIQNKVTSYGNTNQIIILVSNNIADSNNQTTTANWINWLSNNNITLYYSKQPTEETVALPNIPTIKGTTTFEIDTEVQPSNMYIKYKSK